MTAWSVAFITFACVFGGALAGTWLRCRLPGHHLREDSKDMVRLVTGLVATLSALVLGLLIASSKSSFDAVNEGFKESAAKIILVDRALAQYGPEVRDVREAVRNAYAARIRQLFPDDRSSGTAGDSPNGPASVETLDQKLLAFAPASELQRLQKARALQLSDEIAQARWMAFEAVGTRTPPIFLAAFVARLAETIVEVEGQDRGSSIYNMDWLEARVRWHLDGKACRGRVLLPECAHKQISAFIGVR
jgi:hypothetical protein